MADSTKPTPPAEKPAAQASAKPSEPAAPAKDELLAAAQKQAPHVDRAFLAKHGLDDEYLGKLARGEEPPPPYNGPDYTTDLHLTDGGWQITPVGVSPEDVGKDAISR